MDLRALESEARKQCRNRIAPKVDVWSDTAATDDRKTWQQIQFLDSVPPGGVKRKGLLMAERRMEEVIQTVDALVQVEKTVLVAIAPLLFGA